MTYDPEIDEILRGESHQQFLDNDSDTAYENVNGGYKYYANNQLIWNKDVSIAKLKLCKSADSLKEIDRLLSDIFEQWHSKDGHWRYIAQTYTVRVINWVLNKTVKEYKRGNIKKTPAHYFTHLIRFRTKKKLLTATIGSHKQQFSGKEENVTQ